MRMEYVIIAIVLFVIVLLVILGFAKDIIPDFAHGLGNVTSQIKATA